MQENSLISNAHLPKYTARSLLRIVRSVAFVIGVFLLVPGALLIGKSVLLLTSGVSTVGHVEEILPLDPNRTRGAPQMVVKFTTGNGHVVRFKDAADRMFSHQVGQSVEVLYDRNNPSRAVVNKPMSLWLGTYHLTLMGGALCAMAYLIHKTLKQAGAWQVPNA